MSSSLCCALTAYVLEFEQQTSRGDGPASHALASASKSMLPMLHVVTLNSHDMRRRFSGVRAYLFSLFAAKQVAKWNLGKLFKDKSATMTGTLSIQGPKPEESPPVQLSWKVLYCYVNSRGYRKRIALVAQRLPPITTDPAGSFRAVRCFASCCNVVGERLGEGGGGGIDISGAPPLSNGSPPLPLFLTFSVVHSGLSRAHLPPHSYHLSSLHLSMFTHGCACAVPVC